MPVDREVDVAIVGAGLAGLAAARKANAAGLSTVVMEARDRVGGRTVNQPIGDGKIVEMGGEWIGPTQDRIYELADELDIDTFPTHVEGDEIAFIGGKRHRYSGEMPRINPLVVADFAQCILRLERLAKRIPTERPWEAPKAEKYDEQTFRTWLNRTLKTKRGRAMLNVYTGALFAAETSNFSLLHALFYIRSGTSFRVLASMEDGAQQDRIVGGSQVISERMAKQLGDAVLLNAPVQQIVQDGTGVTLKSDGVEVRSKRIIIAIPPALAGRIFFEPPLPPERDQLMQRLPQGTVIKVNLIYDEPFWRRDGLEGLAWSPSLPVTAVVDNSPPDGSPGVLVGFIEGNNARRLARESPESRRKLVVDSFVEYHGPKAADPIAYHELDWSTERWTRGCYGAHFPPGVWTGFGDVLRAPVERIHWAGTETSSVWNGYMEGAVRSGELTADEVLARLS